MGCTTKLLGHAPGGPKIRLESGPTVARTTHKSPPARSHKSLIPDLSNASGRQLRHTKSYTLPHKKRETITDSISRSRSVTNNFPAEKGPTALLSSGGSPKRDRKLVGGVASPFLDNSTVPKSHAQARLEILLAKEAEQRSVDGIRPRIDRRLLGSDQTFGHYENIRRIMVKHILTVTPPPSLHRGRDDLYDQLSTSLDTRFAAAYLMTRYWFLCEVGDRLSEFAGFVAYSWQLAIACIALCVRMQRDFLLPLHPVTNKELVLLAPRDMTVHELEQAQRDVLEATSYSLQGNTPQPFLEELRCSLPIFQQLAAPNTTKDLNERFWARMFDALLQRDVLFTPISMLAASVLVSIAPAERAAALREEVCSELKMTKHEFEQVSAWFEGVEKTFG